MNYRTCADCGCSMDPGEGKNGICEDCIQKEADREMKKSAMELLGNLDVGFRQSRIEDLQAKLLMENSL